MTRPRRSLTASVLLVVAWTGFLAVPASAGPEGQMTIARTESTAARWFDPAEAEGIITPFFYYYALHDALVKPMPGNPLAPCLAESWSTSADGLTYEFVLRKGVKFHNGDPVAAEDVKFSFERYKGAAAKTLKDRVVAVEVVDPQRVRFRLKRPWPDFMTFYGTPATGAGWIVPKRYVEQVGDDGFKKAPIGAGPYKFVSFKPGVELILEANEQFWRKTPSVKTLVMRSVPDESTRLAMLKRSEADVAYAFRGPLAEEIRRSPGLTLSPSTPLSPSGWSSPSSGTRSRHGRIGGFALRPTSPLTARPSIRPKPWASRNSPPASSRKASRATGRPRSTRTTLRGRGSCWRRPGIPMASMPARSPRTSRSHRPPRR